MPEDLWYIIPISAVGENRSAIYVAPRQPRNRYFRYLEAWHLLRAPGLGEAAELDNQAAAIASELRLSALLASTYNN